ncbi:MAG: hypothetical protein ACOX2N_04445 [Peptococcia bacterium]|jgi:20S proteasome alpha/beta subunit
MTIIMTAVVPDGIVMASESRSIAVNSLLEATTFKQKVNPINYEIQSDNSSKIYRIADYWLAYSGSDFDSRGWNITEEFAKINAAAKGMKIQEVANLIVDTLKNTPPGMVGYAFHLAGYEDYFYPKTIYYSHGEFKPSPGYSNGYTRCGLMMDGETTIIRKIFKDEKILFHSLSLNDAIELLELSITAGAKYLQFFEGYQAVSGGPVDIAVITPDYNGFIKHKTLSLLGKELKI